MALLGLLRYALLAVFALFLVVLLSLLRRDLR